VMLFSASITNIMRYSRHSASVERLAVMTFITPLHLKSKGNVAISAVINNEVNAESKLLRA
jgi:hypothetical protein